MSYVERRRFLWVLFLAGLALLAAVAASATTLSRLKLEDLAQESTAVAHAMPGSHKPVGTRRDLDGDEI